MTPEEQANELMDLLDQFLNFQFKSLKSFTLVGSPVGDDKRAGRVGLSDSDGLCDSGYKHIYLFLQNWIIYFSTNTILIRYEEKFDEGVDEIFRGSIDDFLMDYFQYSTQYPLLSKDFFLRVKNFMSTYNWIEQP